MADSFLFDNCSFDRRDGIINVFGGQGKRILEFEKLAYFAPSPPSLPNVFEALWKRAETLESRLESAAKETDTAPSEAQQEAGNYKKGKIRLHGLEISIETPKGAYREGADWRQQMTAHYGYINRTIGADGPDQVDIFIGPQPETELVFVINQMKAPTFTRFDEHKAIIGVHTEAEARSLYLSNYEDGWGGLGSVTAMTVPQFKTWLDRGDQTKKAAENSKRHATKWVFSCCGQPFKADEPYPDVTMCEVCERFGPPRKQEKSAEVKDPGELVAATFHQSVSYDPICPHCKEVMWERHYWPDVDYDGSVYRHRGGCWDKGPFRVDWPEKENRGDT